MKVILSARKAFKLYLCEVELQKDQLDGAQMCEVQLLCFDKVTHVWRPGHFLLTRVLAILLPLWWHQLSPQKWAQVATMKAQKGGIRECELPERGKRGEEPSQHREKSYLLRRVDGTTTQKSSSVGSWLIAGQALYMPFLSGWGGSRSRSHGHHQNLSW